MNTISWGVHEAQQVKISRIIVAIGGGGVRVRSPLYRGHSGAHPYPIAALFFSTGLIETFPVVGLPALDSNLRYQFRIQTFDFLYHNHTSLTTGPRLYSCLVSYFFYSVCIVCNVCCIHSSKASDQTDTHLKLKWASICKIRISRRVGFFCMI